jgi:hypothetical protein
MPSVLRSEQGSVGARQTRTKRTAGHVRDNVTFELVLEPLSERLTTKLRPTPDREFLVPLVGNVLDPDLPQQSVHHGDGFLTPDLGSYR